MYISFGYFLFLKKLKVIMVVAPYLSGLAIIDYSKTLKVRMMVTPFDSHNRVVI